MIQFIFCFEAFHTFSLLYFPLPHFQRPLQQVRAADTGKRSVIQVWFMLTARVLCRTSDSRKIKSYFWYYGQENKLGESQKVGIGANLAYTRVGLLCTRRN